MLISSILFLLLFYPAAPALRLSDSICSNNSSSLFCQKYNERKINNPPQVSIQGKVFVRSTRLRKDDPSCPKLKDEYDQVCFTPPPAQALLETKAFCDAFVETCRHTLETNLFTDLEHIKIDYSMYCKKQKERFLYVCPEPLRFHTYADDALEFCARYRSRCPEVKLPSEPVQFRDKNADHIYTKEIEAMCKQGRRMARNYCTDPDLLKVPKYAVPCALYKYQCIDIFSRVIYG